MKMAGLKPINDDGVEIEINGHKVMLYTRKQVEYWNRKTIDGRTSDYLMDRIYTKDLEQVCFNCGDKWEFLLSNDNVIDIDQETAIYYCNNSNCSIVLFFHSRNIFK